MDGMMQEMSPAFVWVFMPLLIAGGAALVTAALMQARGEVALSRHRETIAEARALLATQHRAMAERIRAAEEAARRQALDDFMADIRVEERQFVRENGSLLARRKALVVQERVCFRNIPLTGWTEREAPGCPAQPQATAPAPVAETGYLPQNIIRAAITNRKPA
jgi:hypothetical protein